MNMGPEDRVCEVLTVPDFGRSESVLRSGGQTVWPLPLGLRGFLVTLNHWCSIF